MAAPRKYSDDIRERATRLAVEARRDPASSVGAIRRIADQLGVHPEALRTWVKQAETAASAGAGAGPGVTSVEAARIAELEREVRELRRANQILKSAVSRTGRECMPVEAAQEKGVLRGMSSAAGACQVFCVWWRSGLLVEWVVVRGVGGRGSGWRGR
ncbi:transposase [Dactylosporangium sp. NPDC049525]|uniref:transposase n=1 Tax=Dactylosporangium sp. NPDC049525 TaxID=3154730 RepID=UPI00341EAC55